MSSLLLALMLSAAPASTAPASPAERAELQKAYDAFAAACLTQDVPAVMGALTSDVTWISPDGKVMRRAEVEKEMRDFTSSLGPGSTLRFEMRSLTRTPEGFQADVHLSGHIVPADKAKAASDFVSGWKDLWVKSQGRWKNKTGLEYTVTPPPVATK